MKIIMHKKLLCYSLSMLLGITVTTSALAPRPAEAFDTVSALGSLIGLGAQYAYLNKQVDYINNDEKGREKYLAQVKEKVGVSEEPRANAMLDDIMQRLSAAIAQTDPSIQEKPYNYFVNKEKTFNAFCTLGHNLSVNIGLFDLLNYNEDEIALVVAHEMGHGQNNDPANGVKKTLPLQVLAALYQSQNVDAVSIIGANVIANIGNAKSVTLPMEKAADEKAFQYTEAAGYNIGAGAATWQRVLEKMGENNTNFISEIFNPADHPGNIARRDKYNAKITSYSNNKVKVNSKNGLITVNDHVFCTPAALSSISTLERAYLIAGNLSKVYHEKTIQNPLASFSEGRIWLNDEAIMQVTADDNVDELLANLNTANKASYPAKKNSTNKTGSKGYFRQKVDAALGEK
ncbi:MAG: M48 family metallopeptidase [Acidaminococcaceae bacterium]|nr:M48 family metallopeptidase [Acidaminococcaceae bacterium]MDD4721587.1 M48 family metallopeptidase [Acidaminococcaceae bacterium]